MSDGDQDLAVERTRATSTRLILPPGRLVGPYVVQGLLGATPWATTYAAITPPNRHVALKVIDPELADVPDVLDAFEALLLPLTELSDELLLRPLDAGEHDETGAPFVVTDLCRYPSLAELVGVAPLSAAEVTALFAHLGRALDSAAEGGLAHLALKPTNLFVGPPPEHALRVADFGMDILRRADATREPSDSTWLAPEQLLALAPVDGARADVYTASLLAFFALTGESFQTDAALPTPARPSERSSLLDAAFDEVLLCGLERDPAHRFASVSLLAEALAKVSAPPRQRAAPPIGSLEHHAKASGRMARFRLPGAPEVEAAPAEPGDALESSLASEPPAAPAPPTIPAPPPIKVASPARTTRMAPFKLPSPRRVSSAPTKPPPQPVTETLKGIPKFELPAAKERDEPRPIDKTQRLAPYEGPSAPATRAGQRSDSERATARRHRFSVDRWQQLVELARNRPVVVLGVAAGLAVVALIVVVVALVVVALALR